MDAESSSLGLSVSLDLAAFDEPLILMSQRSTSRCCDLLFFLSSDFLFSNGVDSEMETKEIVSDILPMLLVGQDSLDTPRSHITTGDSLYPLPHQRSTGEVEFH